MNHEKTTNKRTESYELDETFLNFFIGGNITLVLVDQFQD